MSPNTRCRKNRQVKSGKIDLQVVSLAFGRFPCLIWSMKIEGQVALKKGVEEEISIQARKSGQLEKILNRYNLKDWQLFLRK